MKYPPTLKKTIILIACAFALCGVSSTQAALYFVEVITSPLISNPNAPFYLDFQMNSGGTGSGNSATVNNFTFVGGGPTGSSTVYGNASGDLTTGVSFTADPVNAFTEIYQSFNPGTKVSFYVNVTANSAPGTPDSFHFAILDSTDLVLPQIPTSAPNTLDLFAIEINGTASAWSWTGTGDYEGISATFTAVPEASTYLAGVFALLPFGLQLIRRMGRCKQIA